MILGSAVPRKRSDFSSLDLADGRLVYADAAPQAVRLNSAAWEILQLCDGDLDAAQIVRSLAKRYGCVPEQLEEDVSSALKDLARAGLISLDPPT